MNTGYGVSAPGNYGVMVSSYPVDVQFPPLENKNKLFAIPVAGLLIREVLLIPHLIILYVLHIVVSILQFVLWIPVLFTGRYPDWGHLLVGGTLSWNTRVSAYFMGLSDQYPAFSLSDPGGTTEAHMLLQPPAASNRLYAVPIVGFFVKVVMLIPHIIVLYVLGLLSLVAMLFAWIPVLMSGTYPTWGLTLVGGTLRWSTRVYAFWFGLTDVYPPFRLEA